MSFESSLTGCRQSSKQSRSKQKQSHFLSVSQQSQQLFWKHLPSNGVTLMFPVRVVIFRPRCFNLSSAAPNRFEAGFCSDIHEPTQKDQDNALALSISDAWRNKNKIFTRRSLASNLSQRQLTLKRFLVFIPQLKKKKKCCSHLIFLVPLL